MESWFSTVKHELGEHFDSCGEAQMALFDYIEAFYNQRRRHSTLGQISPAEFERRANEEGVEPMENRRRSVEMRKHVEESVATGAAAGRGRGGRFSAGRKREVVMRLRGEDLESVSRAVGITAARASHWRAQFLAAGQSRAARRMPGTTTTVGCRPRSASC